MLDNVTWYRQSALRFSDGERTVYIDPWGTDEDAPPADLILITHAHDDHLQPDEIARLSGAGAQIVAPYDVAAELSGDVTPVAPGETHEVAGVRFTTVPAYNMAEERLQMHPKENRWVGYVLELAGRHVLPRRRHRPRAGARRREDRRGVPADRRHVHDGRGRGRGPGPVDGAADRRADALRLRRRDRRATRERFRDLAAPVAVQFMTPQNPFELE